MPFGKRSDRTVRRGVAAAQRGCLAASDAAGRYVVQRTRDR